MVAETVRDRLEAAGSLGLPYLEPSAYVNDLVGLILDNAYHSLLGNPVYPDLFLIATRQRKSYLLGIAGRQYLVHDEGYIEIVSKLLYLLQSSARHDLGILFPFVVEQMISSGHLQAAEILLESASIETFCLEPRRDGFAQTYRSLHWEMGVTSYLSTKHFDDICRQVVVGHELGHFAIRRNAALESMLSELCELRRTCLAVNDHSAASWYTDSEEFRADVFGFWCAIGTCLAWPEGAQRGFLTWIVGSHLLVLAVMCLLEAVREIGVHHWFLDSPNRLEKIRKCLERIRFRYRVHQEFVRQSNVLRPPNGGRRYFSKPRKLDPRIKSEYIACSDFLWEKLTESVMTIGELIGTVFSGKTPSYAQIEISPVHASKLENGLAQLMMTKDSFATLQSPTFWRPANHRAPTGVMRLQHGRSTYNTDIVETKFHSGSIVHFDGKVFS